MLVDNDWLLAFLYLVVLLFHAVSIVTAVLMILLTLSELSTYLSVTTFDVITIDTSLDEKIRIHLNVTFHALHCDGAFSRSTTLCFALDFCVG